MIPRIITVYLIPEENQKKTISMERKL